VKSKHSGLAAVIVCCLLLLLSGFSVRAGGSIAWEDVQGRLKDAPGLLRVIDEAFEVNRVGDALRLGPRSVDVMEGRAEVGTRVPPYTFYCKVRGHSGDYDLVLVLDEQGEGWQFTVRERGPRD
jgi:hypothetical protein